MSYPGAPGVPATGAAAYMPVAYQLSYPSMGYSGTGQVMMPMMGGMMHSMRPRQPHNTPSKGIYLGNIHPETTEADLYAIFARFGHIENIKMMKDKNCAFVNYADINSSTAAYQAGQGGLMVRGQMVRVNWGRPDPAVAGMAGGYGMGGSAVAKPMQGPSRVLWVGNLPYDTQLVELQALFQGFPGFESARILLGKGFGFVTFDTLANADAAKAALTGRTVRGMPMRINYGRDDPNPRAQMGVPVPGVASTVAPGVAAAAASAAAASSGASSAATGAGTGAGTTSGAGTAGTAGAAATDGGAAPAYGQDYGQAASTYGPSRPAGAATGATRYAPY